MTEAHESAGDGAGDAVVDLLGAMAYGQLTAFLRLADDAEMAPTLPEKAALARIAASEFGHFEQICDRLRQLGADPQTAMLPFVAAVDAFHARTAPNDWLEGLVKAYDGEGIATDFYREVSAYVDADTRALVHGVVDDADHVDIVVAAVRAAIQADPRVAGRLALWGRRLVGEALSQAQRVAADRDALASLLVGATDQPGADLLEVGRMFSRMTQTHTERMARLGLTA